MGELLLERGDHAAAESTFREALAIRLTLLPPDHSDVGVSYLNPGSALALARHNDEAGVVLDSALAVLVPSFGPDHGLARTALAWRDFTRS